MGIQEIFDLFYNLNEHLEDAARQYGFWIYVILFLIVFSETGLIVFVFLPGDSLIFAAGSLAAVDALDTTTLFFLMPVAAFAGDQMNYLLGMWIGNKIIKSGKLPFANEENLAKTRKFYKKHGPKTIIYGRYIPVIRSFTPFVAASATHMPYSRFVKFSAIGAVSWALIFLLIGYSLGQVPFVKDNFYIVVIAILVGSMVPIGIGLLRERKKNS